MEQIKISITEYCSYHQQVDPDFIHALAEAGLIQLQREEEYEALLTDELNILEKYARMHYDMDINIPGIEAISHLLRRLEAMQEELSLLRNRVSFFNQPPTFSGE